MIVPAAESARHLAVPDRDQHGKKSFKAKTAQ